MGRYMQYGTTTFRQRTVLVIPFVGDGAPTSRFNNYLFYTSSHSYHAKRLQNKL